MIYRLCKKNKIAGSDYYIFILIYSNRISLLIKFYLPMFCHSVFQLKSLFHILRDSLPESTLKEQERTLQIIILKSSGMWGVKWVCMFAETVAFQAVQRLQRYERFSFLGYFFCYASYIFSLSGIPLILCYLTILVSLHILVILHPGNQEFCYRITKGNIIFTYLLLTNYKYQVLINSYILSQISQFIIIH